MLPHLRNRFPVSFVGTVPAIKPAASTTRSRLISVLATPGTVKRDYTRALIDTYASHLEVTLVGSTRLARIAEDHLSGRPVDDVEIAREIKPCFRRHLGRRTDRIVLACTHYPFLIDHFRRLAPWQVEWIDPAPAIARRVVQLVGAAPAGAGRAPGGRDLHRRGGGEPGARARARGDGVGDRRDGEICRCFVTIGSLHLRMSVVVLRHYNSSGAHVQAL